MKKILLIEDDRNLNEDLELLLSLSGYQVISTNDGKQGVEIAIKENPNLIICDIKMPELDGYGVLHIINNHPKTSGIPFIFLTGNTEFEHQRKGMNLGADDYLIKPVDGTDLLNAISVRLTKNELLKSNFHRNHENQSASDKVVNQNRNQTHLITDKHELQTYKKKHLLYGVGQRPTALYFIKSGKIKEFLINEDGKELITGIYTVGDFFGYNEIFKECNYGKNAKVIEDASLVLIPKDEFLQKIHSDTIVAREFISLLTNNVTENENVLINMAYNSLRKKVAQGITRIIDKFNDLKDGQHFIDISREDLASVVGSSQESMIRTLKDFKTEKLINVGDNGRITILNESKIRNLKF
jgi:DNA-binding response OmpR family regulator